MALGSCVLEFLVFLRRGVSAMRGMSWEGNAEGDMSLLTCIVGLGSRSRCLCVGPFLNTVGKYVGATVMVSSQASRRLLFPCRYRTVLQSF